MKFKEFNKSITIRDLGGRSFDCILRDAEEEAMRLLGNKDVSDPLLNLDHVTSRLNNYRGDSEREYQFTLSYSKYVTDNDISDE